MGDGIKTVITGAGGLLASVITEVNALLQLVVLVLTIGVMAFQLRKWFWGWVAEVRRERVNTRDDDEPRI